MNGPKRARTADLMTASHALSQAELWAHNFLYFPQACITILQAEWNYIRQQLQKLGNSRKILALITSGGGSWLLLFSSSRAVAQPGSAFAWGAKGRRFKSSQPDHSINMAATPVPPDIDAEIRWVRAKQLATMIGPIPSVLVDLSSYLWKTHLDLVKNDSQDLTQECARHIRIIDNTPKLRAPILQGAAALYPEKYAASAGEDNAAKMLHVLGPGMLASLLALVYYHRRLKKVAPAEEEERLSKDMILNMELGFFLGTQSAALGQPDGILLGGVRHLAMGTFLLANPKEFAGYRRRAKKKFDLDFERDVWGCDHTQVAAHLVFELGIKKDMFGVSQALRKIGRQSVNLPPDLQLWRAALVFIDFLKAGICPPPDTSCVNLLGLSSPQTHEAAKNKYAQLVEAGSSFSWMIRSYKQGE